jgi:hypothetical protein
MVICHIWISIAKDNENCPLVLEIMPGDPRIQRENYSWPEDRRNLDYP